MTPTGRFFRSESKATLLILRVLCVNCMSKETKQMKKKQSQGSSKFCIHKLVSAGWDFNKTRTTTHQPRPQPDRKWLDASEIRWTKPSFKDVWNTSKNSGIIYQPQLVDWMSEPPVDYHPPTPSFSGKWRESLKDVGMSKCVECKGSPIS